MRKFHDEPTLNCLAVVDEQIRINNVLRCLEIMRLGTQGFFRELVGWRYCMQIMSPSPLVFDAKEKLPRMSQSVAQLDEQQLIDGLSVLLNGINLGAGRMTDLIKAVTDQQITTARYTNTLTLLPGNVPIDEHTKERLNRRQTFLAGYFNLDNSKAYNDVYGYSAMDNIMKLAARVLQERAQESCDFLGHIGGDDFLMAFTSPDWELRLANPLRRYFQDEHIVAVGLFTQNRQGANVFQALLSFSDGLVGVVQRNLFQAYKCPIAWWKPKTRSKKSLAALTF